MSNHARRYKLTDFKQKRRDEASIVIELDDGSEVSIPPVEDWPDRLPRALDAAGRAILGEDEYKRFLAGGGSGRWLDAIITDAQGAKAGESSASTGS